jgi:two-component system CheB/CheR fusion protein
MPFHAPPSSDWQFELENLFASSEISTILLDRTLNIRSFTPAAAQLFGLSSNDAGQLLTDFGHRLDYAKLREDLLQVVETGKPVERRVDTLPHPRFEPRVYLARHLPYRLHSDEVEGVIATFVDITLLAGAEKRLRSLVAELTHRVNNMFTMVIALANQTAAEYPAKEHFLPVYQDRLLGLARIFALLSRKEMTGVDLHDLLRTELAARGLDALPRRIDGPSLLLSPKTALSFGLVLSELSSHLERRREEGTKDELHIAWSTSTEEGPGQHRLHFHWRTRQTNPGESGGATPPSDDLIAQEIRHGLDGELDMRIEKRALQVALSFPLPRRAGA